MEPFLTREQEDWLEAAVAAGRFDSVADGVRAAINDWMAGLEDDLAWARPDVEAARASLARGKALEGDAVLTRLQHRIDRHSGA